MRIVYYGNAQDITGTECEEVEVSDRISSLASLTAWFRLHRPSIGEMIAADAARVAVDERVVGEEDNFSQPRVVSVFPPLSGG